MSARCLVTHDGNVTVRANEEIFIWNVTSNKVIKIPTPKYHKRAYCITPDNKQIISCCETISIYNITSGEKVASFGDCSLHLFMEMACGVTPDGSKLLAISDVFTVWDLETQKQIVNASFLGQCIALQMMPDGLHALVENFNYDVMIMEIATGNILHIVTFDGIVSELAVLENGTIALVHAQKLHYFTYDLTHIETYAFDEPISCMSVSGNKYCFGCTNGRVLFRTREDGVLDGDGEKHNHTGDKWQLGVSRKDPKTANIRRKRSRTTPADAGGYRAWLARPQA